jgi:hypothetical protein
VGIERFFVTRCRSAYVVRYVWIDSVGVIGPSKMEPVGEFTPCFLRVVAQFSAHADPNTLTGFRIRYFTRYAILILLVKNTSLKKKAEDL